MNITGELPIVFSPIIHRRVFSMDRQEDVWADIAKTQKENGLRIHTATVQFGGLTYLSYFWFLS